MSRTEERALAPPWGRHAIPEAELLALRVGPLAVWARARSDEIWLAHEPGDWARAAEDPGPEPPGEDAWIRWPVSEGAEEIVLSPVFPPRPVVAEPELAFRLLPGARARVYVRVPLWARVEAGGGKGPPLIELPTLILSDTWWGGFTEGELCYWLPTTARRQVRPEVFVPHLAVCPLELSNLSGEELEVEKIALRVGHLSVFGDEGRLWADETRIRYRGEDEGSDIRMSGEPPAEAPGAVRVTAPRSAIDRSFRARTFARLKALSGLGGL